MVVSLDKMFERVELVEEKKKHVYKSGCGMSWENKGKHLMWFVFFFWGGALTLNKLHENPSHTYGNIYMHYPHNSQPPQKNTTISLSVSPVYPFVGWNAERHPRVNSHRCGKSTSCRPLSYRFSWISTSMWVNQRGTSRILPMASLIWGKWCNCFPSPVTFQDWRWSLVVWRLSNNGPCNTLRVP